MFYIKKIVFYDNFNIKKELINQYLTLKNYNVYGETEIKYFEFDYNKKLYDRIKKINNIYDKNNFNHKRYIDIIEFCIKNCHTHDQIIEDMLVDELSKTINQEILEEMKKLSD